MKPSDVLAIALVTVLWACGGDAATPGAAGDDGDVAVEPEPSDEVGFPLEVLAALPDARPRGDVPAERAEEELAYTLQWLKATLRPSVAKRVDPRRFHFVSDLGPRGDDAVVGSLTVEDGSVEVIDGRELVFVVRDAARDDNVQELWVRLFGLERIETPRTKTDVTMLRLGSLPEGGTWGTIGFVKTPVCWFASPPRWYRLGDCTVYSFEKRLLGPRGPGIPEGDAPRYVGGIPPSDPRRHLRFEPTNRVSLSQERARELNGPNEPRTGPSSGSAVGRGTPKSEDSR